MEKNERLTVKENLKTGTMVRILYESRSKDRIELVDIFFFH